MEKDSAGAREGRLTVEGSAGYEDGWRAGGEDAGQGGGCGR